MPDTCLMHYTSLVDKGVLFLFEMIERVMKRGMDHYDENRWGIGMKIVRVNARYMLNALYEFGGQRSPFSFRND